MHEAVGNISKSAPHLNGQMAKEDATNPYDGRSSSGRAWREGYEARWGHAPPAKPVKPPARKGSREIPDPTPPESFKPPTLPRPSVMANTPAVNRCASCNHLYGAAQGTEVWVVEPSPGYHTRICEKCAEGIV